MALKFCKKCGGILISKRMDRVNSYLYCKNCDNFEVVKAGKNSDTSSSEKIKKEESRGEGAVTDRNIMATYRHKCRECGYGKAQVLDLGIFYSDEDNLILLKCGKCGACERIGRKTS